MLFLVSTPIGNLEDMTFRAVRTMKEVDYVLCEDSREARKLLNHYEISAPLVVYNAHSHTGKAGKILSDLKAGKNIALISDAGTPLLQDPGILLVQDAIKHGVPISVIPGASALLTALVASGFDTNNFQFWGFIPHKKGRETLFKKLAETVDTVVLYESPHRILKTLEQMQIFCPEKKVVLGRELTKKFEEYLRGTAEELAEHFKANQVRGEFVMVVG